MKQRYIRKKTNWNRDETILALDLYFKANSGDYRTLQRRDIRPSLRFCAGVDEAADQLNNITTPFPRQAIVVFSDGKHNPPIGSART